MAQNDPVATIIRLLMNQALCASCIAAGTRLPLDTVVEALERMGRVRAITQTDERCPICQNPGPVYRVPDTR